jgi:hypothetical protein
LEERKSALDNHRWLVPITHMSIAMVNPRAVRFYKECLRKLRLLQPEQRGYYYYYLRQVGLPRCLRECLVRRSC